MLSLLKVVLGIGSLAAATSASPLRESGPVPACGNGPASEEHMAISRELRLIEKRVLSDDYKAPEDIQVPVYVHIVASSNTVEGGFVDQRQNAKDMIVGLNEGYKGMGFNFTLMNITYTINEDWAIQTEMLGTEMKNSLRLGDYKTLNLYYIVDVWGDWDGLCNYPMTVDERGDNFFADGCIIQASSMNNNVSTIHEVGHWLGLIHTFEGGCSGGDLVDDTPAMEDTGYGVCEEGQNTCPGQPGLDPVRNYMSYGSCRDSFTAGQRARMETMWNYYRANSTV
ncbi:hypothetical protein K4F52_006068 [Lecanicillium sp. MT-2017a]|nr:hypothetical protein K4F52_006068 [Lecanicillium sp. MT-2017a]